MEDIDASMADRGGAAPRDEDPAGESPSQSASEKKGRPEINTVTLSGLLNAIVSCRNADAFYGLPDCLDFDLVGWCRWIRRSSP